MKQHLAISGRYKITTYEVGTGRQLYESGWISNLIVDTGLQEILDDLIEKRSTGIPISSFKLGTGSTPPAASDTGLESPEVTTDFIANRTRTDEAILFEFFLSDAEVPDDDYTECGLFIGSTLFARSIISPTYTKGSNQDTKIDYQITLTAQADS